MAHLVLDVDLGAAVEQQPGGRGVASAGVSNVIPSIIIFSSGIPELWTPHTYTRSRRREKNEFGISRMYISIILIHIEGLHENVENVRKSKKIE